jgi:hypothetical protein
MESIQKNYQKLKVDFERLEELGKIAGKKYCFRIGKILLSLKENLSLQEYL